MITVPEFETLGHSALGTLLPGAPPRASGAFAWSATILGVIVRLEYQPEIGELAVSLEEPGQTDPPFEVSDVLRVTECPPASWHRLQDLHTQDPEVAERLLALATDCLSAYGGEFLSGNPSAFSLARQDRSERAREYTEAISSAPAIEAADAAWRAGDLASVVAALRPLRERLPGRELRRLEFAERRLGRESR